jgi:hypothetical protein
MTEVEIPFNGWSKERLREGAKTATSRTKRYGDPGDVFEVEGQVYVLTHVVQLPLGIVANHFTEEEGAASYGEFIEVWQDLHPTKGYTPDRQVHLHLFRRAATD